MVLAARREVEDAARSAREPAGWVAGITSPAGWAYYDLLRARSRDEEGG
jgi:hypothetical protein